jgi:hypothetical protein
VQTSFIFGDILAYFSRMSNKALDEGGFGLSDI